MKKRNKDRLVFDTITDQSWSIHPTVLDPPSATAIEFKQVSWGSELGHKFATAL